MRIEQKRLSELPGWEKNPRRIGKKEAKTLSASLRKFGLLAVPIYNETTGRLIGGHQRVAALSSLLGDAVVPVAVVSMDETQEKALNLTLNNTAARGEWILEATRDLLTDFDLVTLKDLGLEWLAPKPAKEETEPVKVELKAYCKCPQCGERCPVKI